MLTRLLGLNSEELRQRLQEEGEPAYRGDQIAEWIYRHQAHTFAEMTNLGQTLRAQLETKYQVGRSRVINVQHGQDGTAKLLLEMRDGALVETVGLPYPEHFTCCLSTQVGCPIGCVFCATGLSGYTRNLEPGEIVDQALTVQEEMRSSTSPGGNDIRRLDHVTFMGMGEPLLNYEATIKALHLLNEEMGMGMRNITVSTVGLVTGINRLAQEKLQVTLAVSLHAPNDNLRRKLIPRMGQWSVAEIIKACRDYARDTGRRVTFEYCLLGGVNDGTAEAHQLALLLRGLKCHVNLIPYNPVPGLAFKAPSSRQIQVFREILSSAGIQVTQRFQRGQGIDAACGQLRQRAMKKAPVEQY